MAVLSRRFRQASSDRGDLTAATYDWEYTQPWTVFAEVKFESNVFGMLLGKQESSGNFRGWGVFMRGGTTGPTLAATLSNTNTADIAVHTAAEFSTGVWRAVSVTWSGSGAASGLAFRVNGAAQSVTTIDDALAAGTIRNSVEAQIGCRGGSAAPAFFGDFSGRRIALFNRVLTSTELGNLEAGATRPQDISGCVGWWECGPLNDGSDVVADWSESGHTAFLTGTITNTTGPSVTALTPNVGTTGGKALSGPLTRSASNPVLKNQGYTTGGTTPAGTAGDQIGPGAVVRMGTADYLAFLENATGAISLDPTHQTGTFDWDTPTLYGTSSDLVTWSLVNQGVAASALLNCNNIGADATTKAALRGETSVSSVWRDRTTGEWHALFHFGNNTGPRQIGHAKYVGALTSGRPLTAGGWAIQNGGGAVIAPGATGAWDAGSVADAYVLVSPDGYPILDGAGQMICVYAGVDATGAEQIGLARSSTSGASWGKEATNPIIPKGAAGAWDAGATYPGTPIYHAKLGVVGMWYGGEPTTDASNTPGIGFAYASLSDLTSTGWTKGLFNPVLTRAGAASLEATIGNTIAALFDGTTVNLLYREDNGTSGATGFRGRGLATLTVPDASVSGSLAKSLTLGLAATGQLAIQGSATKAIGPLALAASGTVGAGPATQLVISTQPGAADLNGINRYGTPFVKQAVVQVLDASGTLTTSTAAVTAALLSGTGTLIGTVTKNAVAGVATFTDLAINGSGVFYLVFTSPGLTQAISTRLYVATQTAQAPTLPQFSVNTTMPTRTGVIRTVSAGGDLQAAINAASPGDWVVIDDGITLSNATGFILPAKVGADTIAGGNNVVVIIRSGYASLPPQGRRVTSSDWVNFPKIRCTANNVPVFTTDAADGVAGYRLVGLDIAPDPVVTSSGHLIRLGDGNPVQNTSARVPSNLIVDRCHVSGLAAGEILRGVELHCAYGAVVDSYIEDLVSVNSDTQAILTYNGPGPLKIDNNYLEAGSENFMSGGADVSVPNQLPRDITFTRNHCTKKLSWNPNDPSYAGTAWSVKNLFEIKYGQRILVEGNVFEYCWTGFQTGTAILLKVNSDQGLESTDLTFRYNIVRGAGGGVNVLGFENPVARFAVHDNLLLDIGTAKWDPTNQNGRLFQWFNAIDLVLRHNTGPKAVGMAGSTDLPPSLRPILDDNIMDRGVYGVKAAGYTEGTVSLNAQALGAVWEFLHNVLIGGLNSATYPATTDGSVGTVAAMQFTDPTPGVDNYQLLATSPGHLAASDGTDVGVDFGTLSAKTAGAVSGVWPSPVSGSLARPIGTLALVASAALRIQGALTAVLGTLRGAGTGTLGPSGSSTGTLAARLTPTLVGSGTLRIAGALAQPLAVLRAAAAGVHAVYGTASGGHTYVAIDDTRRYVVRTGTMGLLKVVVAVGDTTPPITGTLLLADRKTPQNLTGATVTLEVRKIADGTVVFTGRPVTIVDAVLGKVEYDWQAGDTATAGRYEGRWHVVYADLKVESFPNGHDGFPITIETP